MIILQVNLLIESYITKGILYFFKVHTPLPEETVEDMNKMLILVETVDDLEKSIKYRNYYKR